MSKRWARIVARVVVLLEGSRVEAREQDGKGKRDRGCEATAADLRSADDGGMNAAASERSADGEVAVRDSGDERSAPRDGGRPEGGAGVGVAAGDAGGATGNAVPGNGGRGVAPPCAEGLIVLGLPERQAAYLIELLRKQADDIAPIIVGQLERSSSGRSGECQDGMEHAAQKAIARGRESPVADRRWSWMRARSTGSSHVKAGVGCQDFAACLETVGGDDTALIAVVSDGAGAAMFASDGSRAVVGTMARRLARFAREATESPKVREDLAGEWLRDARDRIARMARAKNARPRDFAATLVAALVCPSGIAVCHVGDGACVARRQGEESWEVVSGPAHGEYASMTFFVTDDPQPQLRVTYLEGQFSEVALFSDGLERLALDFASGTAFSGFFGPLSAPLSRIPAGHDRSLSAALKKFLDSPQVIERTDDDKSLIVARRRSTQT